jgi:hypothetical protein
MVTELHFVEMVIEEVMIGRVVAAVVVLIEEPALVAVIAVGMGEGSPQHRKRERQSKAAPVHEALLIGSSPQC